MVSNEEDLVFGHLESMDDGRAQTPFLGPDLHSGTRCVREKGIGRMDDVREKKKRERGGIKPDKEALLLQFLDRLHRPVTAVVVHVNDLSQLDAVPLLGKRFFFFWCQTTSRVHKRREGRGRKDEDALDVMLSTRGRMLGCSLKEGTTIEIFAIWSVCCLSLCVRF